MTARQQTARLAALLARERQAMSEFLLALAEFDRSRAWLGLGHASLFSFLRRELGLSAGAAQYRKTAADLVRRYPEVADALREGKLCLSSVIELAKVLAPENAREVIPQFFGLSSRDAAAVAASIRPRVDPPTRELVTMGTSAPLLATGSATPAPRPTSSPTGATEGPLVLAKEGSASAGTAVGNTAPAGRRTPHREPSPAIEPVDADRARLHVTVSRRLLDKLERAKAELSHSRPGATMEEVIEAALDAMLAARARRKGLVENPRPFRSTVTGDRIAAAVRREVWRRSGGRCEWPLEAGGTCGSTLRLELDHVTPRAQGGSSDSSNLRVLCRFHNQLAARHAFGDDWMDRFTLGAVTRAAAPNEQ